MFLPALAGGGAERVMLDLTTEFGRRGVSVDLVVAVNEGELRSEVPASVRLVDLHLARTIFAVGPLADYLTQQRPTALLSTLGHANVVAALAGRKAARHGTPPATRVVLREANTYSAAAQRPSLGGAVMTLARNYAYPKADAFVAVSEGVRAALLKGVPKAAGKTTVIDNPAVTPRVLRARGVTPDHPWFRQDQVAREPVIVTVGRLAEQKDQRTLLRAFALSQEAAPSRLVMLGDGPLRSDLEALSGELGIKGRVAFLGFVPDPFPYVAAADLFVLSSIFEGSPNALIQALALRVPVVSTDCPSGPREILADGEFGRLVPVGDVAALTEAMLATLREPSPRAPDEWLARYTVAQVASEYLRVLGVRSEA